LSLAAGQFPMIDSGIPRLPRSGDFTYEGLLYFSAISTNKLPGILTQITGLPDNWHLIQGYVAGMYEFYNNPSDDVFKFTYSKIDTLNSALDNTGSGVFPYAFQNDIYALWSNQYPLNWNNIKVPVYWVNTELGFGDASYSISLLKNSKVTYSVVSGYGHADPVYASTAEKDFWNKLFP
jgi:hypothetical protein